MGGIKGKSGGARPGAGRTSLSKRNDNKRIPVSNQIHDLLTQYSDGLGLSRSDIVESLCLLYLDKRNKDIDHCPKCESPVFFDFGQGSVLETTEFKCSKCGEEIRIDGEGTSETPEPSVVIKLKDLEEFDLRSLKPGEVVKIE